jgi:hypothetical protein
MGASLFQKLTLDTRPDIYYIVCRRHCKPMINKTNPLVGKTITAIYLATDNQAIKFDIAGSKPIVAIVVAIVDGDYRSYTWIESLDMPNAILNSPVTSVEDINMPDLGNPDVDEYDVVKYYGCKITTQKGSCVIDYRNSSNSHYGGDMWWPGDDDHYYDGNNWTKIT